MTLTASERDLQARAADWPGFDDWRALDVTALAQIAERAGSDFATALLHDRLTRFPEHSELLRALHEDAAAELDALPTVALVPGAGYREYPETGAGGGRILSILANQATSRRGRQQPVHMIPIASFGTMAANARIIIDWLLACDERDLVLVSLS
ncbi:MAG: hypothetical protein AB7K24_21995, partial [Gemmataceae bacterium]